MARISGIQIPTEKRVLIALTYVYGIGLTTSKKILSATKIDPSTRVKDLTDAQLDQIRGLIDNDHIVEGTLRQVVSNNIKRLKEIGSYRGDRHTKNLPLRGQRTKTNARTKRGRKSTVGGTKKVAAQKT